MPCVSTARNQHEGEVEGKRRSAQVSVYFKTGSHRSHLTPRSYLDALHYSIDGNFHLNMKKKDTDPDDFAYSMGAGYFVHERDFQHFLRKVPPPVNEVSCIPMYSVACTNVKSVIDVQSVRRDGQRQVHREGNRRHRHFLSAHVHVARWRS